MNHQEPSSAATNLSRKIWHFMLSYYPVLLVFLLHQVLIALSTTGLQYSIFRIGDFVRYDSYLYIDIAKNGYELFPCWTRFEAYPQNSPDWCGNAGWMPLYPYMMKLLMLCGLHEFTAGFIITKLCYLALLFFIFSLLKHQDKTSRTISLLLAGIFPSSIYYASAFPISLTLALIFGTYYFWQKQSYIAANILAFLTPLAYATGFLIGFPWGLLTVILLLKKSSQWKSTCMLCLSICLGFATFFIIQKLNTGHWNSFFLIQAKYGHGFHNIWQPIADMIRSIWVSGLNDNWLNIQTLVFLMLFVLILVHSFKERNQQALFFNLCFIVYMAFPMLIGTASHSHYRAQSFLLPVIFFLGQRKKLAMILMPVFVYLFICCAIDFFTMKIG
jgi:hypothetical protein